MLSRSVFGLLSALRCKHRINARAPGDSQRHFGDVVLSQGVTRPTRYCLPSHRLREQLSGRCENTESCCFFFSSSPRPPSPPPRWPPPSNFFSWVSPELMNEVLFAVMSKCAAPTHTEPLGEKWHDAALSPRLSADGQTLRACSRGRRRPLIQLSTPSIHRKNTYFVITDAACNKRSNVNNCNNQTNYVIIILKC